MKKPNSQSFQKTLVLAATVAALGASLGVPVEQALAAEGGGVGEVRSTGATQHKTEVIRHKTQKWGATQEKWKTKTMLNPQPLPPGLQSPYHPGPVELNPQPLPPGAK